MASLLREQKFEINRNEMKRINNTFRFVMLIGSICTFGLWVVLYVIYLLKAMLLAAGARMFIAETILNKALGSGMLTDEMPHADEFPAFWMFFLFSMGIAVILANIYRHKKTNYVIFISYLGTLFYGGYSLLFGKEPLIMSIVLVVGSAFGLWATNLTFSLFKALEKLSYQEGFPDFIDIIDEPHPIANTNGIYYKQYLHLKQENERKKKLLQMQAQNPDYVPPSNPEDVFKKVEDFAPRSAEMDTVSIDFSEPIEELLKKTEHKK